MPHAIKITAATAHTTRESRKPSTRTSHVPSHGSPLWTRVRRPKRVTSAGSSKNVAIQHNTMPIAPITAKSAKPLKLVAASEPYAIAAPSAAIKVGLSVPTIAAASASSTSARLRSSR